MMSGFIADLEIGGQNYIFTANREAKIRQEKLVANIVKRTGNDVPDIEIVKGFLTFALLKEKHPNITLEEAEKIRFLALSAEEYGDKFDEFLVKMMEECVTIGKKHLSFFESEE